MYQRTKLRTPSDIIDAYESPSMEEPKALVLVAAFETTFCPFPFQRCCLLEHARALLVEKKIDLVSFSLRGGNDFF